MLHYYKRLRQLRESQSREIKQQEIAQLLGTTQQTYSLWERGEREIPFHHVITLAKYYRVSLDYIAELTDQKKISR
jgi:transcriptional regulator with XRE-family HTH domain